MTEFVDWMWTPSVHFLKRRIDMTDGVELAPSSDQSLQTNTASAKTAGGNAVSANAASSTAPSANAASAKSAGGDSNANAIAHAARPSLVCIIPGI